MTSSMQCTKDDLAALVMPKFDIRRLSTELQNETNKCNRLERKIQNREAQYHAILKAFDGFMYVCSKDYRIEFMNNLLIERTGYNGVGDFCYKILHDRDSPCPWCVNDRVFNGETVRWNIQSPKDSRWLCNVNTPIIHANGDISKLAMILDITEQKQAERDLQENEKLYRLFVDNISEGIILLQGGKIVFVNDAFLSIFGYTGKRQVIGKRALTLVDGSSTNDFEAFLHRNLKGESKRLSFRGKFLKKNGRKFWAEHVTTAIDYKGKQTILSTVRDITKDMLRQETLKEESNRLRSENVKLKASLKDRYRFGNIIGKSPGMQAVYELILKAASIEANVIILGESGTGKELVARAIHEMGNRRDKPFVPVNCGAIPDHLIENEFFGHKKGAFTGAHIDKEGYLAISDGGTLFLDEVGEIGLNMQVKLLRIIESKEFTPVGETKSQKSDFRFISATNSNLTDMLREDLMRRDFYYRISVIPIFLPPLRHRKEDIPLLVEYFLRNYNAERKLPCMSGKIMDALKNYDWPGNVRELQNVLQRFVTVGELNFMDIRDETIHAGMGNIPEKSADQETFGYQSTLADVERKFLVQALDKCKWNRTKTASCLGLSRRALFRRMKKLGI